MEDASKNRLYQYTACPFCCKVRVGLSYKNVSYDPVEVHPLNKKEIEFSRNWKKVPIWVAEDGSQVNDSSEILKYLDKKFEGPSIFQDTEEEKKWMEWTEGFVKSVPPAIYDTLPNSWRAFSYITKSGKFSFGQQKMIQASGAAIMRMVSKKIKKRLNITDPHKHLDEKLSEWVKNLGEKPFMGGDKPNAADISLYGFTMSFQDLPASGAFQRVKGFEAWRSRMAETTHLH